MNSGHILTSSSEPKAIQNMDKQFYFIIYFDNFNMRFKIQINCINYLISKFKQSFHIQTLFIVQHLLLFSLNFS